MYRNHQEKKGNNYTRFVNMTLKIGKYHKAYSYSKKSRAKFRNVSFKEHFILRKIQKVPKLAIIIIMY